MGDCGGERGDGLGDLVEMDAGLWGGGERKGACLRKCRFCMGKQTMFGFGLEDSGSLGRQRGV